MAVRQPENPPTNANKGDWFIDSDGQHWVKQDYGGWASTSGPGTGTNLTSTVGDGSSTTVTEENSSQTTQTITSGPVGGETGAESGTLRWPEDVKYSESDYVLFQFGKYIPPFSQDINTLRQSKGLATKEEATAQETRTRQYINAAGYDLYNQENLDIDADDLNNIVLPIPQDLSNEIQQVWQGKQFTAGGRAAIAGLAGGQFHYASRMMENITGHMKAAQTAINTAVLNAIPGVGGNIEFNDVSGSTSGIVINPNAELMYDSPEMREVGMVFKMVPRNSDESDIIRKIYQTFRQASLPSFGGSAEAKKLFISEGDDTSASELGSDENVESLTAENNWIRVPSLCKFTFMKGGAKHPHLIQFKPCAISKVEVNYTADGTYASYSDGAPLSVELTLNFMETKVIFRQDVGKGF